MYNDNRGQLGRTRASSVSGMRQGLQRHSDIPTYAEKSNASRPTAQRSSYSASPADETSPRNFGLRGYPLASVYAPIQEWQKINEPSEALELGTLFAELYFPFEGTQGRKGGL